MRLEITTMSLNRHSRLDPLSPKREDKSLSRRGLRVCARNDGKSAVVVS